MFLTSFLPTLIRTSRVTFSSEAFYNRNDVKAILHAPTNITWHGCRPGSGRRRKLAKEPKRERTAEDHRKLFYMINDRPISVAPFIADLLNGGIPVVVYNGDRDMTTNMVGTELVLNQMSEWNELDKWYDAPRGAWKDQASTSKHPEAGWAKEYGHLTYLVVYNRYECVALIRMFTLIQNLTFLVLSITVKSGHMVSNDNSDVVRALCHPLVLTWCCARN